MAYIGRIKIINCKKDKNVILNLIKIVYSKYMLINLNQAIISVTQAV